MIDCELPTEGRNPRTLDVDTLPTMEVLRLINSEDATVPRVVGSVLPEVARLVDLAVESLRAGGRVHYFGAGTSGRLAVLDAAELPPTFGIWGRVVAHNAGGPGALSQAVSGVEDDVDLGRRDALDVGPGDVAIGIAASGRTPYVVGALRAAAAVGARTALISCNPHTPYGDEVEVHIGLATGPEVISGSTRMKAGTATKLVLNSFSTTLMIRMGRTYSNLMVSVNALNSKLRARLVRILTEATGMDARTCENALSEAGGNTRVALVSLLGEVPASRATMVLEETDGGVREALQRLRSA
ncbi:N-acetylmuramic acid 6-phosphate etherase [Actinomadura luteofluorescens]|uniref:N-acetylmuramic acid 6-phosphate etherase n=1 Tax=Actinomadura luteofluorescens TaxID=46163 RepID=A0A7Y9EKS2_9ACTN|nr:MULTISPECIES: N-acetylmuramic acid 6-phosphate etherase [Actinomadura]MCR3742563.1 N-acetylmuramic acid 6-phosphate etherase [Actinomadura glauciflava]NYD49499.1 N-acetylmuramic acid 6-phosphate etherase [Actinomadura luteofluorescens]